LSVERINPLLPVQVDFYVKIRMNFSTIFWWGIPLKIGFAEDSIKRLINLKDNSKNNILQGKINFYQRIGFSSACRFQGLAPSNVVKSITSQYALNASQLETWRIKLKGSFDNGFKKYFFGFLMGSVKLHNHNTQL
jgi:hypothetical protein